ncbi:MAG: DNA repair protein RecO [Thioalkalivibrionaceae bacterium]
MMSLIAPVFVLHQRVLIGGQRRYDLFDGQGRRIVALARGRSGPGLQPFRRYRWATRHAPKADGDAADRRYAEGLIASGDAADAEAAVLRVHDDAFELVATATLADTRLVAALYLNELLLRAWPAQTASPALFRAYAAALQSLADGRDIAWTLRRFEWTLFVALDLGVEHLPLQDRVGARTRVVSSGPGLGPIKHSSVGDEPKADEPFPWSTPRVRAFGSSKNCSPESKSELWFVVDQGWQLLTGFEMKSVRGVRMASLVRWDAVMRAQIESFEGSVLEAGAAPAESRSEEEWFELMAHLVSLDPEFARGLRDVHRLVLHQFLGGRELATRALWNECQRGAGAND